MRLLELAQSSAEFPIQDKLKLKAKRKGEELRDKLFSKNSGLPVGVEIRFKSMPEKASEFHKEEHVHCWNYSHEWVEENADYPTLLNNFIHLFDYVDDHFRCSFVSLKSKLGVFERHLGVKGKKEYETGIVFQVTGTRRVGKTTIQYQMIEALLNSGVSPQKIVFISMDHPMLKLSQFQDILECYHENIYPNQDVYYFFDEVQYAQDWDRWLKIIYDTQPDTHVVATGSASPALIKGSQESGAGRWSVIQVPTLSFYEYCELLKLDRPDIPEDLKITSLLNKSQFERTQIMLQLSKVQHHFIRYLQVGGFPELALSGNDLMAQQIMREDVVDKVLKRDLPSLYSIRNATELERIFLYLCNVSSDVVSIDAITKELNGVSRTTVENYIQYLESANLIYQSWPVDMAGKKVLKASPKIYIADAAIRNAVLMDDSILTDPTEMGKMVETAVYKHVAAFYYQFATSVGYFRGGKKGKEIDIVVEYPNIKNILIEVKYRESAPIADDDSIVELCDEASAAIVVTKNATDFGLHNTKHEHDLLRIPAFAFLYLLGNAEKHGYRGIE